MTRVSNYFMTLLDTGLTSAIFPFLRERWSPLTPVNHTLKCFRAFEGFENLSFVYLVLYALEHIKWIVTLATLGLVFCLRSAHSMYFTIGMYVCGFSAKALQSQLRQCRPNGSTKKSYGMPSAHAASMTYIASYSILAVLFENSNLALPPNGIFDFVIAHRCAQYFGIEKAFFNLIIKWIATSNITLLAVGVCWSRHRFQHHTKVQILAGVGFGLFFAILWYSVWYKFISLNTLKNGLKSLFHIFVLRLMNKTWYLRSIHSHIK